MAEERSARRRAKGSSQEQYRPSDFVRSKTVREEAGTGTDAPATTLSIYVSEHCAVCVYAHEVATAIRVRYPNVVVDVIDVSKSPADVPEAVFATPTYMLNGRIWSLGNPSEEMIRETFG